MRGLNSLVGLVVLALDIIALIDIYKSSKETGKKVIWALVILFFPLVGMIVYYIFGRKPGTPLPGQQ
jgi:hypothetical protein